jgi:hypothetical protein
MMILPSSLLGVWGGKRHTHTHEHKTWDDIIQGLRGGAA